MTKKKALTPAQRAVKKERKKLFMHVLVNEKQVRVKRPATVDGIGVDEFIQRNADPIWLHQNEMYECIDEDEVHTEP